MTSSVILGEGAWSLEQVQRLAAGEARVEISAQPDFRRRIDAGVAFLDETLAREGLVYGVTTGYGDSCTTAVPLALVPELPAHLVRFHGCGMGRNFTRVQARATCAARLASLGRGLSGVSFALLQRLALLLNEDIVPVIPEEGSVGASGDLTPLSYVAAVLMGERTVMYQGEIVPTAQVYQALNLQPLQFRPKEALAMMNGTAVMTGLACLAYQRAAYLSRLAARLTAWCVVALQGNRGHYDETLFNAKPHPGQQEVASWLRSDLCVHTRRPDPTRIQDRYSLRCAPHVIGVLVDSLPWLRQFIEAEVNSANDNPLIDPEARLILHGGHFYGGHIAFAMDALKTAVANIADLLDRQLAQLCDTKFNHGLPANLSGAAGERAAINHGFKAVQIAVSAWTAEALKLTMPASVFSRSTECHNQDKVSMGTIAARDCGRVLELTEQVVAACLLANAQAVRLREAQGGHVEMSEPARAMLDDVGMLCAPVQEDRPLQADLQACVEWINQRRWVF